jgi:hypothetical protein
MRTIFLAMALATTLSAASIPLFNTGTDAANNALGPANSTSKPNLMEAHFSLISGPSPANVFLTRWQSPYFSETGLNARWISPAVIQAGASTPPSFPNSSGTYVLQQTFDMTPFDISTASLSGRIGADNCATIRLNTTILASTGGSCSGGNPTSNFTSLTSFSASSGAFITGINTLRIDFSNASAASGLLVADLQGTANPAVPEPATYALIGTSLLAIQIRRKLT